MINNYLKYLQEEEQHVNEFVVLPIVLISTKIYKKIIQHKKIAQYCIKTDGVERRKCFLKFRIKALEKTIQEISKFKKTCKKWSKNVPKCIAKVEKEIIELNKRIKKLQIKLKEL